MTCSSELHRGKKSLLPPHRRARVEERSARLEQAEIVRGEDALALVSVLQHVDAVLAGHGFAHEIARPLVETGGTCTPPRLHLLCVRPGQPVLALDGSLRTRRIVV